MSFILPQILFLAVEESRIRSCFVHCMLQVNVGRLLRLKKLNSLNSTPQVGKREPDRKKHLAQLLGSGLIAILLHEEPIESGFVLIHEFHTT